MSVHRTIPFPVCLYAGEFKDNFFHIQVILLSLLNNNVRLDTKSYFTYNRCNLYETVRHIDHSKT